MTELQHTHELHKVIGDTERCVVTWQVSIIDSFAVTAMYTDVVIEAGESGHR